MLEAFLAAARFMHYASLTVLFGALAFPFYAGRDLQAVPAAWRRRIGAAAFGALGAALASGALWFLLAAAGMSGDISGAMDPSALLAALTQTPFGPLWCGRLALLVLTWAALAHPVRRLEAVGPAVLAGLLLASLALTGHAQSQEGGWRLAHGTADALHLLAAGAWIGGLVVLAFVIDQAGRTEAPPIAPVLRGFSSMGYLAVAVLILTGVVNSLFVLARPMDLIGTGYGRLLMFKIGLFLAMLGLAAVNRLWISPALTTGNQAVWLARLKRHVLAEQVLAALVLLAVAVLGTLDPGA